MFNTNNGYSLSDIAAATGNRNGDDFFGNGSWWLIILFLFCFNGGWGGGYGNRGMDGFSQILDTNSIKTGLADGFYSVNNSLLNGFSNTNAGIATGFANISNSLCGGFGNVNSTITNSAREIQSQLSGADYRNLENTYMLSNQMNNIAQNQQLGNFQTNQTLASNHADLSYKLASEACENRRTTSDGIRDIIEAGNSNTKAILDFLTQNKIDELTAENAALRNAQSQAEQNAYLVNALGNKPAIPAYIVQNPYTSYNPCTSCTGYSY